MSCIFFRGLFPHEIAICDLLRNQLIAGAILCAVLLLTPLPQRKSNVYFVEASPDEEKIELQERCMPRTDSVFVIDLSLKWNYLIDSALDMWQHTARTFTVSRPFFRFFLSQNSLK